MNGAWACAIVLDLYIIAGAPHMGVTSIP
jgi:hypothetical protein